MLSKKLLLCKHRRKDKSGANRLPSASKLFKCAIKYVLDFIHFPSQQLNNINRN